MSFLKIFFVYVACLCVAIMLAVFQAYPVDEIIGTMVVRPLLLALFAFGVSMYSQRRRRQQYLDMGMGEQEALAARAEKMNLAILGMVMLIFIYLLVQLLDDAALEGFVWAPISLGLGVGSALAQSFFYKRSGAGLKK